MSNRGARRARRGAVALAVAGLAIGLTGQPASAHQKTCQLPYDPSQSYSYIVCVAEAEVHNSVWHAVFP